MAACLRTMLHVYLRLEFLLIKTLGTELLEAISMSSGVLAEHQAMEVLYA